MNFRNGIIAGMVLFMVFILSLVVVLSSKGSELTTEDYYLKDKNFQQNINARQLAMDIQNPAIVKIENKLLSIAFKENRLAENVKISFSRPNDKALDREVKIGSVPSTVPVKFLKNGNYDMVITYEIEGKKYEQVEELIVE
ncbi:MAG: hypothetical protein FGM14_09990 [Flavobacteriales bacterium]|nr:hypothetical protein [Flavobacteriales bacterium]